MSRHDCVLFAGAEAELWCASSGHADSWIFMSLMFS